MPIIEGYPYTDYHNLNLDWFLEQFKTLAEQWATTQTAWTATQEQFTDLKNYVMTFFQNLDVQEEVNAKLDEMAEDGSLSSLIQPLFNTYKVSIDNTVNTQNNKITVLEGRMDTFASLTEGSTTGDAELIDIRVPAAGFHDNENYPTAGDAVRDQITTVNNEVIHIDDFSTKIPASDNVFDENYDKQGYKLENGNLVADNNYMATSTYYPYNDGVIWVIQSSVAIALSISFYDYNKAYLSSKSVGNSLTKGTTTPDGTRYFRVSLYKQASTYKLAIGHSSFSEYVPYTYIRELTNLKKPIYFEYGNFSAGGREVLVVSKYGNNKDLVTRLWERNRGNRFFDFNALYYIDNKSDMLSHNLDNKVLIQYNETEWHSPYHVTADNNADGDCASEKKFTGGSHDYTNGSYTGSATLRLEDLKIYSDGKEVSIGYKGECDTLEITWTNYIQGSNTEKVDGSGREILKENHRLIFNGIVWNDYTEIQALENLHIHTYYGLQLVGVKSCYPSYRFLGDLNTRAATTPTPLSSNGNTCYKMLGFGSDNKIEVDLDTWCDLGRRKDYTGTDGAFHLYDTNKCYFTIINSTSGVYMNTDSMLSLSGHYRFMPV